MYIYRYTHIHMCVFVSNKTPILINILSINACISIYHTYPLTGVYTEMCIIHIYIYISIYTYVWVCIYIYIPTSMH